MVEIRSQKCQGAVGNCRPDVTSRGCPRCRPTRKAGETEQGKARTRKLMKKSSNRLDVGWSPHEARARRTQQGPYVLLTKTTTKKRNKKKQGNKRIETESKKYKKERKTRKKKKKMQVKTERPKKDLKTGRVKDRPEEKVKRRCNRKVEPGGTRTFFLLRIAP